MCEHLFPRAVKHCLSTLNCPVRSGAKSLFVRRCGGMTQPGLFCGEFFSPVKVWDFSLSSKNMQIKWFSLSTATRGVSVCVWAQILCILTGTDFRTYQFYIQFCQ